MKTDDTLLSEMVIFCGISSWQIMSLHAALIVNTVLKTMHSSQIILDVIWKSE